MPETGVRIPVAVLLGCGGRAAGKESRPAILPPRGAARGFDGIAIAYGIGLWVVLIIGPATVTVLKGQWPLFDYGWYTLGIVWWITGFRLARPESWWARHLYGPAKLARAKARYPEPWMKKRN